MTDLSSFSVAELQAELSRRMIAESLPVVVVHAEGEYTAECPHCSTQGLDNFREIDNSERWNPGQLVLDGDRIVAAAWNTAYVGYDHQRYECATCGKAVTLPDDLDEIYS